MYRKWGKNQKYRVLRQILRFIQRKWTRFPLGFDKNFLCWWKSCKSLVLSHFGIWSDPIFIQEVGLKILKVLRVCMSHLSTSVELRRPWEHLIFFVLIKSHFQWLSANLKKLFKVFLEKIGLATIQSKKLETCILNPKSGVSWSKRSNRMRI